jgi:hypothetical protein
VSQVGLVRLRLDPTLADGGLRSWALVAAPDGGMTDVDGLLTGHGAPLDARAAGRSSDRRVRDRPRRRGHPDLARTIAAIEAGLGLPLLRTRDAGSAGVDAPGVLPHGRVVLEVVGGSEPDRSGGPARFYGIAITVEDLDVAVERAGDRIRQAKAAVQRGARSPPSARTPGWACRWRS